MRLRIVLSLLVLVVAVLLLWRSDSSRDPFASSHALGALEAGSEVAPASLPGAAVRPADATARGSAGTRSAPEPSQGFFIHRELDRRWLEPAGKAGRLRERLVETDFKYPLLRVEERVWDSDPPKVEFVRAMVADHALVGLHERADPDAFHAQLARVALEGALIDRTLALVRFDARPATLGSVDELIARLDPLDAFIDFAEPDWLLHASAVPDDSLWPQLWGLHNTGTESPSVADADIDAPEAWEVRTDAPDIVVAVIDTGVRLTHEDLLPNLWVNSAEIPGNGLDDDNNYVIDDVHGYDAIEDDGDPSDDSGHGTHVAGTIGARGNNALGTSGVAWQVQLMPVKSLGPAGSGATSDAIRAINYARLQGVDLINASWGGFGHSEGLYNAIAACRDAGVIVVTAAGNDASDNDSTPHYPSSFPLANVVSVASSTAEDALSSFSNTGRYTVDLAAPGSGIASCWFTGDSEYRTLDGTSMAAPHVTGALALALAEFPGESMTQTIGRLLASVDPLSAAEGKLASHGRLNLHGLLTAPAPSLVPNDTVAGAFLLEGSYGLWTGSNAEAVSEPGDRLPPDSGNRSLWFRWEAPAEGLADWRVRSSAEAGGHDLRLVVFEANPAGLPARLVADSGPVLAPEPAVARHYVQSGDDFLVAVDSHSPSGLDLVLEMGLRPEHDFLAYALELPGESFLLEDDNRNASAEPFELDNPHAGVGSGKSLWYRWTAPGSGDWVIHTAGSRFDTVLAVYRGDRHDPSSLSEVASNDDRNSFDQTSAVTIPATAGGEFLIAVDSYRASRAGMLVLSASKVGELVIFRQPESLVLPLGARAAFHLTAGSGEAIRYQWFIDDEPLPGATRPSLVIEAIGHDDFGAYHVELSNGIDFLRSDPATLTEERSAPLIVQKTGNLFLATGSNAALSVTAQGSRPLSYEWSLEGALLPGESSSSLALTSIETAQAGLYTCRVSNDLGEATAAIRLSIVDTPFSGWEYRIASQPNATITDLVVHDGTCYAVAGHRLLASTDGIEWTPIALPAGFVGHSLVRFGSQWLCFGPATFIYDGLHVQPQGSPPWCNTALSPDLQSWTVTRAVGPRHPIRDAVEIDGRLVGWANENLGSATRPIVYSEDGITWHDIQVQFLQGAPVTGYNITAPFGVGDGFLVASGRIDSATGQATILRSTNGMQWEETLLPPSPDGPERDPIRGFGEWDGRLWAMSSNGAYASADGIAWTFHESESGFREGGFDFHGDYVNMVTIPISALEYQWTSTIFDSTIRRVGPFPGDTFTVAVPFNDRVVYGTSRGVLRSVTAPQGLMAVDRRRSDLFSLAFLNGLFLCADRQGNFYTSADGIEWTLQRNLIGREDEFPEHYAGGLYWGHNEHGAVVTGHVPNYLVDDRPRPGLEVAPTAMIEDGASILATSDGRLVRSTDHGESWTPVATHLEARDLLRFGDDWFCWARPAGSDEEFVYYHSLYSTSWSRTNLNERHLVTRGDGYLALGRRGSSYYIDAWESADGVAWTQVPMNADSPLPEGDISSVVEFGETVIVWVEHPPAPQVAYFSYDGRTWIRAPFLPESIVGNGQLVARGGLQTSTPGAPAGLVHEELFLARFDTDDPHYPSWVREGAFREDADNEWGGEQVGDRLLGINARPTGGTVLDRGRGYLDLTAAAGLNFEPNTSYFIDLLVGHRPGFDGNRLEWGLWSGLPADLNNEPSLGTTGLADPTNVPFNQLLPADQAGLPNQSFTFQTGPAPPAGPMILFVRNSSFNGGRVYLDEIELRSVSSSAAGAAPPVTIISGPPTVQITSQGSRTGVIIDTAVEITGFADDGEDGANLALSCKVDGIEIATTTGGAFSFSVPVTNHSGHVVEIVATDTDGLRGSDAIVIDTITPQPPDLLGLQAPAALEDPNVTVLDGSFYLQIDGFAFQSYDGQHWRSLATPNGFGGSIAAGAGRLVSRAGRSSFAHSLVDGSRWVRAETFPSSWGSSRGSPLDYAYGFFQPRRFPAGQDHLISSDDGLNWHFVPEVQWGIRTSEHDFVAYFGSHAGKTGLLHSRDGENWYAIPELAHWARPSEAELGDQVLLTSSAQRQWALSDDHGRTWTLGTTPDAFTSLSAAADFVFASTATGDLYRSSNGMQWGLSSGDLPAGAVHFGLGHYVGHTGARMVWSDDGLNWRAGTGAPPGEVVSFASTDLAIVAVFDSGAVWRSTDGIDWIESLAAPREFYAGLGWDMDRFGSRLLLSGQYDMLFYSDDEGRSWTQASKDLQQSHDFFDLEVGAGVALVSASRNQNNRTVLRSVNGSDWFEVVPLIDADIFDTATDGAGTWLAISIRGELWKSVDHGVSWASLASPGVGVGMALYRFGNEWTIIAAPDRFQPCSAWTSTNLESWINRGPTGFTGDFFPTPPRVLQAHGAVVYDSSWITFNNRSWSRIAPPGGGIAPTDTGWISGQFWIAPASAQSWTQIEQPYRPGRIIEFEGRHFLFREGHMGEWYRHDLALAIDKPFAPPAGLGVGDELSVPVTLTNLGDRDWSGGDLELALTLSNNTFLGDGDDIPLGSVTRSTPAIAPEAAEALELIVTLPDTLRGGEFHVFVQVDPDWRRPDCNGSNNSDRSEAASLTIREWELHLATAGDGSVQSDSFRRFYPHNFEVPLIALAGKGSVFAGWSGDAVGSQGETSILMNAERSVTATFATVANLHLTVRGGGTVSGLSPDLRFPVGHTAGLEAVPLPGWTFAGWEGDLAGADPNASLAMSENRTVTARFVLPLEDWRALHFTPAELADPSISGDNADADRDLVTNWREYLHGSDPRDPRDTGTLAWSTSPDFLTLRFTRLAGPEAGHELRVASSPGLATWSATGHDERILDSIDGVDTVEARIPLRPESGGFLRFEYFR